MPAANRSSGLACWSAPVTQFMSFAGSRPDFQSHQPQQIGRDYLQADGFAFQTGDAADVVPSEQLDTPYMHTGEHCLPAKLGERRDLKLCKIQPEIDLGLCQCATDYVRHVQWDLDISNVGKALGPQQVCRRHQRRLADHAIIDEAHRRGFESVLGGQRSRQTEHARRPGQCQCGQKLPARLCNLHRKTSLALPLADRAALFLDGTEALPPILMVDGK